jgi:cytochrome c556
MTALTYRRAAHALMLIALAASLCGTAIAADPDESVRARQTVLKNMGKEMKVIGAIGKSDIESQRKDLVASANAMRAMAAEPWAYFGQETAITRLNTEAKPEIWSDPAGFRTAQEGFINAANALAIGAATDKPDDVRAKIKALGDSCGACHRQFKN